ncbi:hypothetical protein EJ02DRAFT_453460, partial [Clathrospora elynae]
MRHQPELVLWRSGAALRRFHSLSLSFTQVSTFATLQSPLPSRTHSASAFIVEADTSSLLGGGTLAHALVITYLSI